MLETLLYRLQCAYGCLLLHLFGHYCIKKQNVADLCITNSERELGNGSEYQFVTKTWGEKINISDVINDY